MIVSTKLIVSFSTKELIASQDYDGEDCPDNPDCQKDPFFGRAQLRVKLPDGMECWHCILQWTYITGNRYGILIFFQFPQMLFICHQFIIHQVGNWASRSRVRDTRLH